MKNLKIKEALCIAVLIITVLVLVTIIAHDHMQGRQTRYGFFDKAAIILAAIYIVIVSFLFVFEKYKLYRKNRFLSAKIHLFKSLLIIILVAATFGIGGMVFNYYRTEPLNDFEWSIGIYTASSGEPFKFNGENVNNPVLTAEDVTDVKAGFVADPFLIYENNIYYMFFEVWNLPKKQADIGLATSDDGYNWSYEKIVLNEPFHLSYPLVFKWNNEHYMIPETIFTKSIRLYKADDFPYRWRLVKTLLNGKDFVDNTIFHYNNIWWLFTGTGNKNDTLRLYYSDIPSGPWTEHPKSPVVRGNPNTARPGGNVAVFDNRIVRYAQDDYPYYGNQVWAFEITSLTTENYEEQKIGNKPVLKGIDNWNTRGMHHISPCRVDGNKWIAGVDGY